MPLSKKYNSNKQLLSPSEGEKGFGVKGHFPLSLSRSVSQRTLSATVFPSGDFSVGVVPPKKISELDEEYERTKGAIASHRFAEEKDGKLVQGYWYEKERTGIPPNLVNSPKLSQEGSTPSKKYGQNGISGYGKKMLRSAAVMMEREWGKPNCGMGTLTLPPVSVEQLKILAKEWRNVSRRFFQEIGRHFERRTGRRFTYAYCTEIQEKRSADVGVPVLHIHFLYRLRRWGSRGWAVDATYCRRVWRRIIESYIGKLDADVDCRVRLEKCRKSFVGYIGKYLSKGSKSLQTWKDAGDADILPSGWWGMSAHLSKRIRSLCLRSMSALADILWQLCRDGDTVVLQWFWDVCIDIGDRKVRVGYCGQADYVLLKDLLSTS